MDKELGCSLLSGKSLSKRFGKCGCPQCQPSSLSGEYSKMRPFLKRFLDSVQSNNNSKISNKFVNICFFAHFLLSLPLQVVKCTQFCILYAF